MKTQVFVVDDYPLLREGIAQLINNEPDMEVCGGAGNASDALVLIARTQPDIALLDISLNGASGIDLLTQLKILFPALKVLMLSMHGETMLAKRALLAGASGYMLKEEATNNVLQAIRQIQAGETYVSPEIAASLCRQASPRANFIEMPEGMSQLFTQQTNNEETHFRKELRPA